MFYPTISAFFEAEGDFQENLEEHAFQPGDGEMTHVGVCQHTGCGQDISLHEEGEPCCYPGFTTQGAFHSPQCDNPV